MLKSFGSDPELMLQDAKGNYISAIGVIKGNKENKVNLGDNCFAFYDNVLCEVNIKPAYSRNEAVKNFRDCFKKLARLLGDVRIVPQAAQIYPASECQHRDSQIFGCDPEFSLYVRDWRGRFVKLKSPICKPGNYFRSAGGHVHIGSDLATNYGKGKQVQFLKMCDLFLGATSVLIDHDPSSPIRRKLYGGAGTHRPCIKYGIEYRAMSNFWIASPKLVTLIYDLTELVVKMVDQDKVDSLWSKIDPEEVKNSINRFDRETIMKKIFPITSAEMNGRLLSRIESLFEPTHFDFYEEWNLN